MFYTRFVHYVEGSEENDSLLKAVMYVNKCGESEDFNLLYDYFSEAHL